MGAVREVVPLIGTSLGPYRIDAEIGSGGMGRVYRATTARRVAGLDSGVTVALKVVHAHLLETEGFFRRFLREAEIGKSIVHENVVRTLDCDSLMSGGSRIDFLVMEYVEGQTLRALSAELSLVPEELCRHIGREVSKGLAAIHAAGVVHRDMKPDNVLITKRQVVKVMDLGVARLNDEARRLSQTGAFVGSVEYASPEQFRSPSDVDHRADLHALGLILYELATAQHPYHADDFRGVMRKVLDDAPRRAGEVNPQLSPFFEEVVHTLLAKRREDRFAGAAELLRVLEEGEGSSWWKTRTQAIRAETKRPLRRIRIPRETAVYGRSTELAKLTTLFETACAGDGQVVVIEGEPGIGKSRLVDEFVGLLPQRGREFNFLYGSYPPGGAATASGAFSTAYREQFGDADLGETLKDYLKATPVLVPAFAALLRGETTPAGVEPLTKDSLQTVFVHATRALAAERPTIVLVDDLHFAPEEGRALFAALAMAVPGHRVLLVGTARPGVDPKWLGSIERIGASRIALPRLGPKDLVRLLADTLKSEHLAEELSGRIAVKSDGNPFFVFEILRGLREGQFITKRDDGTWATTRVIADIQIPSSVLDLVQARVADLDQDQRNALDVASCLGFEFDPALVAAVLGVGTIPLLQRLAHVEKAHRLVRSAGRRFVFDHHQVQEALYGGMPEMLREEYHAAIASALEAQGGAAEKEPKELGGALCVDLAEHFLRGGKGARALRYLAAALTHLESGYLNDATARLAQRALATPGLVSGRARCELLIRLGRRLDFLGRRDEGIATLEEAVAVARSADVPELLCRALTDLGWNLHLLARYSEAEPPLLAALDLARKTGHRPTESRVSSSLGNLVLQRGRVGEAQAHFERGLALAIESADRGQEGLSRADLCNALLVLGRLEEALAHLDRALALARESSNLRSEANASGNLGVILDQLGRHAEAARHHRRQVELARAIGDRLGESIATGNLGGISASAGRFEEWRSIAERWVVLAREIGHRQGESIALVNVAGALLSLGRTDEARVRLGEGLDLTRRIGLRQVTGWLLTVLADVNWTEGRLADAELGMREAIDVLDSIGDRVEAASCRAMLGALLARSGRIDEARTVLDSARAAAVDSGAPDKEARALAHLAALPGGDPNAAVRALERLAPEFHAQTRMEVLLALFHATGDRVHLAAAKALLDDVLALNPPECRDAMLKNVRLNREIADAAKAAGL